jgi:hypothetical protein
MQRFGTISRALLLICGAPLGVATLGVFVACSESPAPEPPAAGRSATGATAGTPSASGAGGTGDGGMPSASGRGGATNGGTPSASGTSGTSHGGMNAAAGSGVLSGGAPSVGGAGGSAGATNGGMSASGGAGASSAGSPSSAGAAGGGTGPVSDWPSPGYSATRENTGLDCEVAALPEPTAITKIAKLPDPFTKLDGTRMTSRSEWHCRRQEIHAQAEKYIYGEKMRNHTQVSGSVTSTQVTVDVEAEGKTIQFKAKVVLPSTGTGPFPAMINVGSSGMTIGESFVLQQGVAIIYYNHYDLGKEGQAEQSRGDANPGLFYDIYGGFHSAGLLMSWAWGASRLIDVLQQSGADIIDPGRLGVTGCSRNGKGAFAIGVFDERVALTIPVETSTAGVPPYRIVDVLNTERTDHNFYGLNWLSNDFEPFVLNASQLPIDTHELMGMIAPRGLLVLDNPHQTQFSAPAGHIAAQAAVDVYEQLGVRDHLSYISNVTSTPHCGMNKAEYQEPLRQSIARFLKHEAGGPGQIIAGATGMGNLSEWKEWTAPALTQ